MKKHLPLLGIILFIMGLLWAGVFIQQDREQQLEAQAMYEKERHLTVYSDLPAAANRDLATAFYEETGLRVRMVTLTEDALQRSLQHPAPEQQPDAVIASEGTLRTGRLQGAFLPYLSDMTDTVAPERKDDAGAWTGLWYNPLVFVVNRDYYGMGGSNINTWGDLLTDSTMVISFPDLAATDIAGDFLCEYVEQHGTERSALYFRSLQERIGSYTKTMTPIMHRVAGGEAQVGVVDAVTAEQYRFDGAPVYVIFPQDGTSAWLTGAAVTRWCSDEDLAGTFIDWLLSDKAAAVLRQNRLYFHYANSTLPARQDSKQQNLVIFKGTKHYNDSERKSMQDWWLRAVRFGREG